MNKSILIEKMKCNIPELAEFRENIEILDVSEPGYVRFTVDIPRSLGNYRGGIHGGTGYFIGEIGCGFATYSYGVNNVCNSASINFFKSVPCCKVDVRTEPLHKGRSTAVIRVTTFEAATGAKLFESTHNMFLLGPIEGWDEDLAQTDADASPEGALSEEVIASLEALRMHLLEEGNSTLAAKSFIEEHRVAALLEETPELQKLSPEELVARLGS